MSAATLASYVIGKLKSDEAVTGDMSGRGRGSPTPRLTAVWRPKSIPFDIPDTNNSFRNEGSFLRLLRTKSMPLLGREGSTPPGRLAVLPQGHSPSRSESPSPVRRSTSHAVNSRISSGHLSDASESTVPSVATPPPTPRSPSPSGLRLRSASDGHLWQRRKKQMRRATDKAAVMLPSVKNLRGKFDEKLASPPGDEQHPAEPGEADSDHLQMDSETDEGREGRRVSRHYSLVRREVKSPERRQPPKTAVTPANVRKLLEKFEATPQDEDENGEVVSGRESQDLRSKSRSEINLKTTAPETPQKDQTTHRTSSVSRQRTKNHRRSKSEPDPSAVLRHYAQTSPPSVKKLKIMFERESLAVNGRDFHKEATRNHSIPSERQKETTPEPPQTRIPQGKAVAETAILESSAADTLPLGVVNTTEPKQHTKIPSIVEIDHVLAVGTPSVRSLRQRFEEGASGQSLVKTADEEVAPRPRRAIVHQLKTPFEEEERQKSRSVSPEKENRQSLTGFSSASVKNLMRQFEALSPADTQREAQGDMGHDLKSPHTPPPTYSQQMLLTQPLDHAAGDSQQDAESENKYTLDVEVDFTKRLRRQSCTSSSESSSDEEWREEESIRRRKVMEREKKRKEEEAKEVWRIEQEETKLREKIEMERIAKEKERERITKEKEKEKREKERLKQEKEAKENEERERRTKEILEREREAKEKLEEERKIRERAEQERLAKEEKEKEKARELLQQKQKEKEKELEIKKKEREEKEKMEREREEQDKLTKQEEEKRKVREQQKQKEQEKAELELKNRERNEKERMEREEKERKERERAKHENEMQEKAKEERREQEKAQEEEKRKKSEREEAERLQNEQLEEERRKEEERRREELGSLSKEQMPKVVGLEDHDSKSDDKASDLKVHEMIDHFTHLRQHGEDHLSEGKASSEPRVEQLIDQFTNLQDADLEGEARKGDGDGHAGEDDRRYSDVAALVNKFRKINERRKSSSSSSSESDSESEGGRSRDKAAKEAPIPTISARSNVPGKVRTLREDEMRFFESSGSGAATEPFMRTQSLRMKKTEQSHFTQPRFGSLRGSKTRVAVLSTSKATTAALPQNCRRLNTDELRFFTGEVTNIYRNRTAKPRGRAGKTSGGDGRPPRVPHDNALPNTDEFFRLAGRDDRRGEPNGCPAPSEDDSDSEPSVLRGGDDVITDSEGDIYEMDINLRSDADTEDPSDTEHHYDFDHPLSLLVHSIQGELLQPVATEGCKMAEPKCYVVFSPKTYLCSSEDEDEDEDEDEALQFPFISHTLKENVPTPPLKENGISLGVQVEEGTFQVVPGESVMPNASTGSSKAGQGVHEHTDGDDLTSQTVISTYNSEKYANESHVMDSQHTRLTTTENGAIIDFLGETEVDFRPLEGLKGFMLTGRETDSREGNRLLLTSEKRDSSDEEEEEVKKEEEVNIKKINLRQEYSEERGADDSLLLEERQAIDAFLDELDELNSLPPTYKPPPPPCENPLSFMNADDSCSYSSSEDSQGHAGLSADDVRRIEEQVIPHLSLQGLLACPEGPSSTPGGNDGSPDTAKELGDTETPSQDPTIPMRTTEDLFIASSPSGTQECDLTNSFNETLKQEEEEEKEEEELVQKEDTHISSLHSQHPERQNEEEKIEIKGDTAVLGEETEQITLSQDEEDKDIISGREFIKFCREGDQLLLTPEKRDSSDEEEKEEEVNIKKMKLLQEHSEERGPDDSLLLEERQAIEAFLDELDKLNSLPPTYKPPSPPRDNPSSFMNADDSCSYSSSDSSSEDSSEDSQGHAGLSADDVRRIEEQIIPQPSLQGLLACPEGPSSTPGGNDGSPDTAKELGGTETPLQDHITPLGTTKDLFIVAPPSGTQECDLTNSFNNTLEKKKEEEEELVQKEDDHISSLHSQHPERQNEEEKTEIKGDTAVLGEETEQITLSQDEEDKDIKPYREDDQLLLTPEKRDSSDEEKVKKEEKVNIKKTNLLQEHSEERGPDDSQLLEERRAIEAFLDELDKLNSLPPTYKPPPPPRENPSSFMNADDSCSYSSSDSSSEDSSEEEESLVQKEDTHTFSLHSQHPERQNEEEKTEIRGDTAILGEETEQITLSQDEEDKDIISGREFIKFCIFSLWFSIVMYFFSDVL